MEQKRNNPKSPQNVDMKTSTTNLAMNIVIFLLGIIILYMAYSITVKLLHKGEDNAALEASKASGGIIQAEVMNGCGTGGVADRFTDFLRNNKVDIVNVGNYLSFDVNKTMVIDRSGNKATAQKIARMLGIREENIVEQVNNDYFLDVTIVIGSDYKTLNPFK